MIRAISLDDFLRRVNQQGQSNYVFWRKHPCHEVETWADVRDLEARWRAVEENADLILASARGLDAIANARLMEGLELDELTIRSAPSQLLARNRYGAAAGQLSENGRITARVCMS